MLFIILHEYCFIENSPLQLLSHVRFFANPWKASCQASLSISNSQSSPKLMSTESVIPSNYLIPCRPLLLPSSIFPSIRVFSKESVLHIRWPKCWSFSFSISWYIIKFPWISWSKAKTERHRCWFKTVVSKILKDVPFQ